MNPLEIEILLIEDNPSDVELTLHALRHNLVANRIQVARDGADALDFLFCRGAHTEHPPSAMPSIILLDLKLPKVDGLEVLRIIKSNPLTQLIPVVALTSSREDMDLVNSYEYGVNSFIRKPVDFTQFREIIGQLGLYWLVVNEPPAAAQPYARC